MESEKLEDLLLLSLSASKGQRERSEVLDVGVTRDKNLREVIVKYSGDIDGLQIPGMETQKLLAGYAIVKLPEDQIGALVAAREIEYVEMPKNLQTGLYEAKRVSCILPLLSYIYAGSIRWCLLFAVFLSTCKMKGKLETLNLLFVKSFENFTCQLNSVIKIGIS